MKASLIKGIFNSSLSFRTEPGIQIMGGGVPLPTQEGDCCLRIAPCKLDAGVNLNVETLLVRQDAWIIINDDVLGW